MNKTIYVLLAMGCMIAGNVVLVKTAQAADQQVPHKRLDGHTDVITIQDVDGVNFTDCKSIPARELIEDAPAEVCLLVCHGTQDGQPGSLALPFRCEEEQ